MLNQRDNLKRILLKRVLFRVDYRQLATYEIDEVVKNIKEELAEYFGKYDVKTIRNINMQLDSESIEINHSSDAVVHSFSQKDERKEYELIVHNQMTYLEILPTKDSEGTHYYYNIFSRVIGILCRVKFFTLHRFGVRKFNRLFLDATKITDLEKIFKPSFLSIWGELNEFKEKHLQDSYQKDGISYNISRDIQLGKLVEKEAYLILFDYDVFSEEERKLTELINNSNTTIESINKQIFNLFINSLADGFIESVLRQGEIPEYIIV